MKNLSVLAAATMALMINSPAQAGDPVTLNITGNVIASPCQVSSDSITKSVDLGQNIQASSLQTAGSATEWVNFDINLNSCPAGTTKAIMTMHGTADPANPGICIVVPVRQPTWPSSYKVRQVTSWVIQKRFLAPSPITPIPTNCVHGLIPRMAA